MPITVAVDAMGGDAAPSVVVEGALNAARTGSANLRILLFGPVERIRAELDRLGGIKDLPIELHDAPDVIDMAEAPAAAIKTKRRSSIHLGLSAHKAELADAFVSAGNTGAVMAGALLILGRIPNVDRPSLVGFYPTTKGLALLLDSGSNVDCKPEYLVQFARMGSIYAERILRAEGPTVGLLNIGEEPGKGNAQAKTAYDLLREAYGIRFAGNIEGRDVMHHAADVVVTDGFVGNVILKLGESITTALPQMAAQAMRRLELSEGEQQLVGRVLGEIKRPFNYENYGGAPLLGVSGNVIIGHGGSTARAVERMIQAGAELARQGVTEAVASSFARFE
jgi:glycerol-3-phosphate acyltransferase PlsX